MRRYFAALALVCGLLAAAAGAEVFRQQQGTTFRQYQTAWRNLLSVLPTEGGNGFRYETDAGFTWTDTAQDKAITFTRASAAYCDPLDGGYGSWLANGVPCIAGGAYLSEPSAKNELLNNAAIDTWAALNHNGTDGGVVGAPVVTQNAAGCNPAPDGTTTAEQIDFPAVDDTGNSAYSLVYKTFTATAVAWNMSVYVRARDVADSGTLYFNDTASTGNKACTAGAGWSRCDKTWTMTAATHGLSIGPHTGAGPAEPTTQPSLSVCLWEAQAELGSRASSPITNAGTALTRAAGVGSVQSGLYGINPAAWCAGGFLRPDFSAWANYSAPTVISLGTSAAANSAVVAFATTTGKPIFTVIDKDSGSKSVTATSALAFPSAPNWPGVFGCSNNGTLSIWLCTAGTCAVVPTDAPAGAGTGIVTTQPQTAYLASLSTGGQASGYVYGWRAYPGEFRP